jgi:hypothetical protein
MEQSLLAALAKAFPWLCVALAFEAAGTDWSIHRLLHRSEKARTSANVVIANSEIQQPALVESAALHGGLTTLAPTHAPKSAMEWIPVSAA